MTTLRDQFDSALAYVEVSGEKAERASSAHIEVRGVLEADSQLRQWGVETRLIGSYGRKTGIYPGKDVDVFVKLTRLQTTANPTTVYEAVWRVLERRYGDARQGGRSHRQARSVKVDFENEDLSWQQHSAFAVDAVPAVRDRGRWAIPASDPRRWNAAAERWVTTDPERFGGMSTELNQSSSSPAVGGRKAYKPIVKLMRQARSTNLGDRRPGGLFIEFATFEAWKSKLVAGNEWDPLFAATLRRVAERLANATTNPLLDPALGTPVEPAVPESELLNASAEFYRLANLADDAINSGVCQAALNWRRILGGNDRIEYVFPLPGGCDANGNYVGTRVVIPSRTEARRFG